MIQFFKRKGGSGSGGSDDVDDGERELHRLEERLKRLTSQSEDLKAAVDESKKELEKTKQKVRKSRQGALAILQVGVFVISNRLIEGLLHNVVLSYSLVR